MKIRAIVGRHGLPLSVSTHAANHHEVRLVQLCFDFYMIEAKPENLIGDRGYDSDPLDEELRKDGIEMIAPHRSNRSKPPMQDRRWLSRYMRRWLVERFFAGIQWQPHPRPLGILRPKLPRLRTARLPHCPLQAILRQVLLIYAVSRRGCNSRHRPQSTSIMGPAGDYLCRSQLKGATRWRNPWRTPCRTGGCGCRIASRVQIVCAAWRHSLAS
jgi:DDE family transposase